MTTNRTETSLTFRSATLEDGSALWRLIRDAGTLELNSSYFYLVFAADFGDTCLLAEQNGEVVGALIGFRSPRDPESAFVWQIGVAPSMRGQGLAKKMLRAWLELPAVKDARWLTATISEDNIPSTRLFQSVARELGVSCDVQPHFTAESFPDNHPAEPLFRIGPLA